METSMTLLGGSAYTEPFGMMLPGATAPLRICRSTGTDGGTKAWPFRVKLWLAASWRCEETGSVRRR